MAVSETMYVVLYGAVIGLGMSLASMNVSQVIVDGWFDVRKPMMMGIVLSAGGLGGFATPLIMNAVVRVWSWQAGWYIVGCACIIGAILSIVLIKNRPADINEVRDGIGYVPKRKPSSKVQVKSSSQVNMPFSRVLRSFPFYGFTLNYMTRAACFYTLTGYIVLYYTSSGVSDSMAALALSLFSLASLCGRVFFGWIIGIYIDARKGLLVSNLILCAGMIVTGFLGPTSGIFILLSPIIVGFGHGVGLLSLPLAISEFFGSKNFPVSNGIINSSSYLVGSYGPVFTGFLAASTGSYSLAFAIIGLMALIGAVLGMVGKAPESDPIITEKVVAETL